MQATLQSLLPSQAHHRIATVKSHLSQYSNLGIQAPTTLQIELEALLEEQATRRSEELLGWRNQGYFHGLTGLGADRDWADIPLQDAEEQEETREYLLGFAAGQDLGDTYPEARVESLEGLIQEWEAQPDDHPDKAGALERLGETLQMEKARLSLENLAA